MNSIEVEKNCYICTSYMCNSPHARHEHHKAADTAAGAACGSTLQLDSDEAKSCDGVRLLPQILLLGFFCFYFCVKINSLRHCAHAMLNDCASNV
jgi:hypothetical protein